MQLNVKTKYSLKILLATVAVYFSFRYLLPLFLPFLFAYALSFFLTPLVAYFESKTKVRRTIITFFVLGTVVICLLLFVGIFASQLFGQIRHAFANVGQYEIVITDNLHHLCEVMEYHFNINANEMYNHICKTTREAVADLGTDVVIKIMGTSASTIKLFAEIFIFLFTTILASFYMIVSRDKIREKKKESMFYKEITGVLGNVYKVSVTYIKTQLIIMLFTTIVCYVGFLIIKNPYALVLALLVGIMDALPMLGVGIVLIPWGILLLLLKSYRDAIVLLILFVICYGFRELVEPKLVGKGIGISPLMTIVSMYVGLKLFGITGVVLGPIAYVVLKTLLEQL